MIFGNSWWYCCLVGLATVADAELYVTKRIPGKKDAKEVKLKLRPRENISFHRLVRTLSKHGLSAQHLPSLHLDRAEEPIEVMRLPLEFFRDYFNDEQLVEVTLNPQLSGLVEGTFMNGMQLQDTLLMTQKLHTIQMKLGLLNAATLGDRVDAIIDALPVGLYRFLNPLTALMSPRFKATAEGFARLFYVSWGTATDLSSESERALQATLNQLADLGTGRNRVAAAAQLLLSLVKKYPDLARIFKERLGQLQGELSYLMHQIRDKTYRLQVKLGNTSKVRQHRRKEAQKAQKARKAATIGSTTLDKAIAEVDEATTKLHDASTDKEALEAFRSIAGSIRKRTRGTSEKFLLDISQLNTLLDLSPELFNQVTLVVQDHTSVLIADLLEWATGIHFLSINTDSHLRAKVFSFPTFPTFPPSLRKSPQEKAVQLFHKMATVARDVINTLFSLQGITISPKRGSGARDVTELLVSKLLNYLPPVFARVQKLTDRIDSRLAVELDSVAKDLKKLGSTRAKLLKSIQVKSRALKNKAAVAQRRAEKAKAKLEERKAAFSAKSKKREAIKAHKAERRQARRSNAKSSILEVNAPKSIWTASPPKQSAPKTRTKRSEWVKSPAKEKSAPKTRVEKEEWIKGHAKDKPVFTKTRTETSEWVRGSKKGKAAEKKSSPRPSSKSASKSKWVSGRRHRKVTKSSRHVTFQKDEIARPAAVKSGEETDALLMRPLSKATKRMIKYAMRDVDKSVQSTTEDPQIASTLPPIPSVDNF